MMTNATITLLKPTEGTPTAHGRPVVTYAAEGSPFRVWLAPARPSAIMAGRARGVVYDTEITAMLPHSWAWLDTSWRITDGQSVYSVANVVHVNLQGGYHHSIIGVARI